MEEIKGKVEFHIYKEVALIVSVLYSNKKSPEDIIETARQFEKYLREISE